MKKKINLLFYLFLLLIIGIPLFIWLFHHLGVEEVISRIKILKGYQLSLIIFIYLLNVIFWSWRWKTVLNLMGIRNVSLGLTIKARAGNIAVNYLTPSSSFGGEIVRPLVLKKEGNISLKQGILSVIIDRFLEGLVYAFFLLLSAFILLLKKQFIWAIFLFFLGCLLGFGFLFILKTKWFFRLLTWFANLSFFRRFSKGIPQKIEHASQNFLNFFHQRSFSLWICILLSVICFFCLVLQIELFLFFVGEDTSFLNAIVVRTIALLGGFMPIPASVGFYEGAYVLGFSAVGLSAELGFGFSLISRFADFILVALGVILILPYFGELFTLVFKSLINNNGHNHLSRIKKKIS